MKTNTDNQSALTPDVIEFFDQDSNTFSYVVKDPASKSCAVIDSVLNFDYAAGQISYLGADKIIEHVKEQELKVELLLETHVHADHLSAAPYIQSVVGGKIAISKHITVVQEEFGKLFNEGTEFQRDGNQFDILLEDEQAFQIGGLKAIALYTPGHTPACLSYQIGDSVFVGDTLFMPDGGTARADFPGGNARTLYRSIQRLLSLPPETKLYMCHDYQPNGRELKCLTTVEEQIKSNIHVKQSVSEDDFVAMREQRDADLDMPRLIFPSLQINMRAGHLPEPEQNQARYLKVPLSGFKSSRSNQK